MALVEHARTPLGNANVILVRAYSLDVVYKHIDGPWSLDRREARDAGCGCGLILKVG